MSSSGCCGRLEGDFLSTNGEQLFADRRCRMEGAGELYRAVFEKFGDAVEIHIVDPRNVPSLIPMLLHEFWRRRLPMKAIFRTVSALSINTVIVNGSVFSAGKWPSAAALCDHVQLSR